jgi:hypothetical protein
MRKAVQVLAIILFCFCLFCGCIAADYGTELYSGNSDVSVFRPNTGTILAV